MTFHFKNVVVGSDPSANIETKKIHRKIWLRLMDCLKNGWAVQYEEYKHQMTKIVKTKGEPDRVMKYTVLACKGSATLEEKTNEPKI